VVNFSLIKIVIEDPIINKPIIAINMNNGLKKSPNKGGVDTMKQNASSKHKESNIVISAIRALRKVW